MVLPSRIAFTLFGKVDVYWYGILIALGVLGGVLLASVREKRYGLPKGIASDVLFPILPAAIVGARLYFVLFRWSDYSSDLMKVFYLRDGGMAIYGGIIAGLIAGYLYSRHRKISFISLLDLYAPSLALGQAIGRWGNFVNQEAFGVETVNEALKFFPVSVYIEAEGTWHLAAFFYESAWCALIVVLILILERKKVFRHRGDVFIFYTMLYAFERSIVEGIRTDSLMLGSIRISQLLSAVLAAAALIYFIVRRIRQNKEAVK